MDYCDMATLLQYGGFTNPTSADEALLEHFISAASAFIDEKLGRTFAIASGEAPTGHTFSLDNGLLCSYSGRVLWLDEDLCSVPTYAEVPAPTVTIIPMIPPYLRIVRALDSGYWPNPTVLTGYWAYSMTPPALIVQLCLRLATWFHRSKEGEEQDRPIVTPGGIVILPSALPKDIQDIFEVYRRPLRP
jgi:hypothetical protein